MFVVPSRIPSISIGSNTLQRGGGWGAQLQKSRIHFKHNRWRGCGTPLKQPIATLILRFSSYPLDSPLPPRPVFQGRKGSKDRRRGRGIRSFGLRHQKCLRRHLRYKKTLACCATRASCSDTLLNPWTVVDTRKGLPTSDRFLSDRPTNSMTLPQKHCTPFRHFLRKDFLFSLRDVRSCSSCFSRVVRLRHPFRDSRRKQHLTTYHEVGTWRTKKNTYIPTTASTLLQYLYRPYLVLSGAAAPPLGDDVGH